MIATFNPQESRSLQPAWHSKFMKMLPSIRRTAEIAFRKVCAELRQELVQEVIANCLVAYARLVELGREDLAYPTPLARYAVAQSRSGAGSEAN